MSMSNNELSAALWEFGSEHGLEAVASICALTLVGFAHANSGKEMKFTSDLGVVSVAPTVIPKNKKN